MSRIDEIKKIAAARAEAQAAEVQHQNLVTETAIGVREYLDAARGLVNPDQASQDDFEVAALLMAIDPNIIQLLASIAIRQPSPAPNPTPRKAKTPKPKAAPAASLPVAATPAGPVDGGGAGVGNEV